MFRRRPLRRARRVAPPGRNLRPMLGGQVASQSQDLCSPQYARLQSSFVRKTLILHARLTIKTQGWGFWEGGPVVARY
jgi:hypothetical protein